MTHPQCGSAALLPSTSHALLHWRPTQSFLSRNLSPSSRTTTVSHHPCNAFGVHHLSQSSSHDFQQLTPEILSQLCLNNACFHFSPKMVLPLSSLRNISYSLEEPIYHEASKSSNLLLLKKPSVDQEFRLPKTDPGSWGPEEAHP